MYLSNTKSVRLLVLCGAIAVLQAGCERSKVENKTVTTRTTETTQPPSPLAVAENQVTTTNTTEKTVETVKTEAPKEWQRALETRVARLEREVLNERRTESRRRDARLARRETSRERRVATPRVAHVGEKNRLEVIHLAPGRAQLVLEDVVPVYDNMPTGTRDDPLKRARTASELEGRYLCWSGIGAHWNRRECGRITSGKASVTYRMPNQEARDETFVLVPMITDSDRRFIAWAAHPQNVQGVLRCPGKSDVGTFLHIDDKRTISTATLSQRQNFEEWYQRNRC